MTVVVDCTIVQLLNEAIVSITVCECHIVLPFVFEKSKLRYRDRLWIVHHNPLHYLRAGWCRQTSLVMEEFLGVKKTY
jgi:hypothetical protein